MKIVRESTLVTMAFGNVARNDLFEYKGKLYMKIGLSGNIDNAVQVGELVHPITMQAGDDVHVVDSLTYTLEGIE